MAESTLALEFDDFVIEVGEFLSFGASPSGADLTIVDAVIQRGYIQFLNPPILPRETAQHRWSFLHPVVTLTTEAPFSTGTIAYDHTGGANERQITLTSGTWPTTAANGSITISATTYAVATRVDGTILTLAVGDNPGADVSSGTSYELGFQNVDLADNFGGIEGTITYQGQAGKRPIQIIGANQILELRNRQSTPIRAPYVAAVRPRDLADAANDTGQRWEVMFFPTPDEAYVLTFQYIALVNKLVAGAASFPLGGMLHSRTVLASIMAEAERKLEPAPPTYRMYDLFIQQLGGSIMLDRTANTAEYFGYNRDNSDAIHAHHRHFRQHHHGDVYNVTQAGRLFP